MWCSTVGVIVTLTLSILATPLAADAQPAEKVHRIGRLSPGHTLPESNPSGDKDLEAFRQGLRAFGYVEDQNIVIEYRYAEGRDARLTALAAELVRLKMDVIVAIGGAAATRAIQHATRTIPIVMAGASDPVREGLVASLTHPGGEHHRFEQPERGAAREAAGDPQGDGAPERARRRAGQSGQSKPCIRDVQLDRGSPGAGFAPARRGAAPS
jgi:ABC transporter substrate binding protein